MRRMLAAMQEMSLIVILASLTFIGAAMASHAIFEVSDALVQVFASDVGRRMLVTSVTGVLREIALRMAGCARRIMVSIEDKVFVMVECRRLPLVLAMALRTTRCHLLVQ